MRVNGFRTFSEYLKPCKPIPKMTANAKVPDPQLTPITSPIRMSPVFAHWVKGEQLPNGASLNFDPTSPAAQLIDRITVQGLTPEEARRKTARVRYIIRRRIYGKEGPPTFNQIGEEIGLKKARTSVLYLEGIKRLLRLYSGREDQLKGLLTG